MTPLTRLAALACVLSPVLLGAQARGTRPEARPLFADVTAKAGITFVHKSGASGEKYMVETFGSGVAWIDYDNDGFPDLYFVNGAPGASNALYHNNKDGTFTDVTERAGVAANGGAEGPAKAYKTGVAVGDYDNDGFLDLYVTAFGPNILYRNNGDGTFTRRHRQGRCRRRRRTSGAPAPGLSITIATGASTSTSSTISTTVSRRISIAAFGKEGYRMYCHPTQFDGTADRLFHNNGDGTFTDVSKQAGIANPAGKGPGRDVLRLRSRRRSPTSTSPTTRCAISSIETTATARLRTSPMVPASGSIRTASRKPAWEPTARTSTAMGYPDIFVTNFSEELNALYQNRGDGTFEDVSATTGMGAAFLAAGFRNEAVRLRQRWRPGYPRHQRPRDRQRQVVSAEPDLRAEGFPVRERRREVQGRHGARRTGFAGRAHRARAGGRGFRQRRKPRCRDHQPGPTSGPAAKPGRRARQLDYPSRERKEEQHVRAWARP